MAALSGSVLRKLGDRRIWIGLICAGVIAISFVIGRRASPTVLMLLIALAGAALLMRWPILGFPALIVAAIVVPLEFSTGTEVSLNTASLLVPALAAIWLLIGLRQHDLRLVSSRVNRPLIVFLVAGLISLLIGNAIWDPIVPRSDRFIIVQLAQLAIFAFSAFIFWLMGNGVNRVGWLQRITIVYLLLGGSLAIIRILPGGGYFTDAVTTYALERAPFWLMLTALAGGQLLFNQHLTKVWRLLLLGMLGASLYFAFFLQQERSSYWVGVAIALGVLVWLRFRRLRWLSLVVIAALAVSGMLFQALYEFAGGDAKWNESGASRGVLIGRVIELSMRNPITGIGPAAYRPYGFTQPLYYEGAYWVEPRLNSHNNYVDLFSQLGIVGLTIFLWFMGELAWLGLRLRRIFKDGFAGAYVNSMLAMWAGTMAIMGLADWFLPFVYNIGFQGFQASVLVWMFFGGLVALEQIARTQAPDRRLVNTGTGQHPNDRMVKTGDSTTNAPMGSIDRLVHARSNRLTPSTGIIDSQTPIWPE